MICISLKYRTVQLLKNDGLSRFIKYMFGGGVYFWLGYGIFALLYSIFHWDWLPAKIMADVIGWTSNYIIQRFWTFSDRIHLSEMQHAGRYAFIQAIGFIIDYLFIWGLVAVGITPYIGFFMSSGFFTIWNWLWYKYWIFPDKLNPKV